MDFIDALPNSRGYIVIMVVVDRHSKATHFVALKHPYTAVTITQAFMDNIVKLHRLPKSCNKPRTCYGNPLCPIETLSSLAS